VGTVKSATPNLPAEETENGSVTSSTSSELGDESFSLLEQLARGLRLREVALQPMLDGIVSAAVDTIPPALYAGLILLQEGVLTPQATLGEPPHELDVLQRRIEQGPCLDAARSQRLVSVEDTTTDRRWTDFLPRAVELGVASMLCVPLWVDDQLLGALSLYSHRPRAFDDSDVKLTELYAALAAIALADQMRADQLRTGLINRDVIGQAKGVLMERHHVTADSAFAILAAASQRANLKLVVVAAHLADSGELLGQAPMGA
jgi:GAF domain-containing protein